MNKLYTIVIAAGMALLLFACNAPEREPYHTVHEKLQKQQVEGDVDYGVKSTNYLECLRTVETDSAFTDGKFLIPDRISQLKNYKCSACHTQNLEALKMATPGKKKSHWDIHMQHADSSVMS